MAITTYRRPEHAVAAVRSCLNQGPHLQRIIVVDDGSGDDTEQRIAAIGDPRICYHQRPTNGGMSSARHDALALSTADWTIHLDDDWELLPGAVEAFAKLAQRAPTNTVMLGARIVFDDGRLSPLIVPTEPIDYFEQIRWRSMPRSIRMDNVNAVSKAAREHENWLSGRFGRYGITLFYLDVARHGMTLYTPETLVLEHTPTAQSISREKSDRRLRRRKLDAPDGLIAAKYLLDRHGSALLSHGRPVLSFVLTTGAMLHLLLDQRLTALKWSLRAWWLKPTNLYAAVMAAFAVLGRRSFEKVWQIRG